MFLKHFEVLRKTMQLAVVSCLVIAEVQTSRVEILTFTQRNLTLVRVF